MGVTLDFEEAMAKAQFVSELQTRSIGLDHHSAFAIIKSTISIAEDDNLAPIAKNAMAAENNSQITNAMLQSFSPDQVQTILKVAEDVTDQWLTDRAKRRKGAAVREAQARNASGSKLHPEAQEILHRPLDEFRDSEADKPDNIEKLIHKGANEVTDFSNINKKGVEVVMDFAAEKYRKNLMEANPKLHLTKEQGFAKYVTETPEGREMYAIHKRVPAAPAEAPRIAKGEATTTAAYDALMAKAEDIRKSDPKLTHAQAFTKAYCTPENRALVELHKRQSVSLPLDAA